MRRLIATVLLSATVLCLPAGCQKIIGRPVGGFRVVHIK